GDRGRGAGQPAPPRHRPHGDPRQPCLGGARLHRAAAGYPRRAGDAGTRCGMSDLWQILRLWRGRTVWLVAGIAVSLAALAAGVALLAVGGALLAAGALAAPVLLRLLGGARVVLRYL